MKFIMWAAGLSFTLGATGLSLIAIGAAFGFAHPALDFFNHLQAFIFIGTLFCLLASPHIVRLPRWRALAMAISATGFLASSLIVVPDISPELGARPPLPTDGRPVYKLLTHNLFGRNYEAANLWASIQLEDPDILTFQEYFPEQRNGLHALLDDTYPYHSICKGGKRANVAIYAKMPFEAETEGACAQGDTDRISRIVARFAGVNDQPFTVVTTHFDWPGQISQLDQGANIVEGIDLAFARQRSQFADLGAALQQLPGPLVLAGDFNSTSWSYALRGFAAEAGLKRQDHTVPTYPTRYYIWGWRDTLPFLPIDHVMTRGGIAVHELYAGDPAGSDHKSIVTRFSVGALPE